MQCKAYAYTCDISNENQVEELGRKVRKEVGDVEILINNAGILYAKPLLELSNEQVKKTLQVNTLAHFWVSTSLHSKPNELALDFNTIRFRV